MTSQRELRRIQHQLRRDYRLEEAKGGTRMTAAVIAFCILGTLYVLGQVVRSLM